MNKTLFLFKPSLLYSLLSPLYVLAIGIIIYFLEMYLKVQLSNFALYLNIFYALVLVAYLYEFYFTLSLKYHLNADKLVTEKGIFSIDIDYLELYRIKDIKVQKPFLLRLIGVYNLVLYTSDKSTPILFLKGINAKDLAPTLSIWVEQARKDKGVREID